MDLEWDPDKALRNCRKHGIDFADIPEVFADERAITMPQTVGRENRFVALGLDGMGRLLVVVYTWRGDRLRVISARKATRRERRQYKVLP